METACKKNKDTQNKNVSPFASSLNIILLFKNLFNSLFCASYDKLKTRLETMQSH